MSRISAHRMHFYLASVLITYAREESNLKQRHSNLVMQSVEKNITMSALNQAKLALVQRLFVEANISTDMIRDITFLGFSYMGHMTDREFNDLNQTEAKPASESIPRNVYDA